MTETPPTKITHTNLPATFTHFEIYDIPLLNCKPVLMWRLNAPRMYQNCDPLIWTSVGWVLANTKLARSPLLVSLHFIWICDWRLSLQCQFCCLRPTPEKQQESHGFGFSYVSSRKPELIISERTSSGLALFKPRETCGMKLVKDSQQSGAMW